MRKRMHSRIEMRALPMQTGGDGRSKMDKIGTVDRMETVDGMETVDMMDTVGKRRRFAERGTVNFLGSTVAAISSVSNPE
jgi:hypothetical protein